MYKGNRVGYKVHVWVWAGITLGVLCICALGVWGATGSLPTEAFIVPFVGWGLMLGAYYAFPIVRVLWDKPFPGGEFSYTTKPCAYNIPVDTQITLHEPKLDCQACNLPLNLPKKLVVEYKGHHDFEGLLVDILHLAPPYICPHCGERLDDLAFPCSAPGFSYTLPRDTLF